MCLPAHAADEWQDGDEASGQITLVTSFYLLIRRWQLRQRDAVVDAVVVSGEALRLARDFSYLCETEFPTRQAAEHVVRQNSDAVDPPHRKQMALAAK